MYLPEIFEETDLEKLYQLIQDYPFATLISHSAEGLEANHLPFHLLRDKQNQTATLVAHIAKNNPLHTQIESGTEVLYLTELVSKQTTTPSTCTHMELSSRPCQRKHQFSA